MDQAPRADAGPVRIQLDWRTGAWVVAVVLAALTLIALISNTTVVLTQIGIGVIVALALDPLADAFQRRWHLPRVLTVAMIVVALLLLAGVLVLVLGPRAVEEAGKFSEQLPRTLDEIENLPLIGGWARDNDFAQRVLEWVEQLPKQFTDDRIADVASSLVSGVAAIAVVSIVTIAALIDGEEFINRARRLLPLASRPQADQIGRVMYHTIGRYFGGSIAVAFLHGIYVLALGLVLGVPLAPLAAVWAAITSMIPQIGGFLGGTFFTLLAATQGASTGIIAAVGFVIYMTTENNLIQPAVVGKSVDLTPPTTMIAAFAGAAVAGVPGALVATPLVGAMKQIYLEARGRTKDDPGSGLGSLARLRNVIRRKKR